MLFFILLAVGLLALAVEPYFPKLSPALRIAAAVMAGVAMVLALIRGGGL